MHDIFLLLGGNKLNYGIYNKFQKKGYLIYVVDWNESPYLKGDCHLQIDVKDAEAIIEVLKSRSLLSNIRFVYTSIDLAVRSVMEINRAIGFNTLSTESLKYVSSKSSMTDKWNKSNLLNRFSGVYSEYNNNILELNQKYDLIIKPDNSSSSRGITICRRNSDAKYVIDSFEKAKNEASNSLVVVEEFVTGTEFTVEMLGDGVGNVAVYAISKKSHTEYVDNNKIAIKLHYNSVEQNLQKKIAEYAIKCYKSLELTNSFGHLEILLKSNGDLSPVEIGARSSGFIASDLVDIVSGHDYIEDLMSVQQKGAQVYDGLIPQTNLSSMYFFYNIPPGKKVKKETNILEFMDNTIVSRYSDRSGLKLNQCFENIADDNSRIGYEILEGPASILTPQYIEDAEIRMLKEMVGE